MQKANPKKPLRKPQHQQKPGAEYKMERSPRFNAPGVKPRSLSANPVEKGIRVNAVAPRLIWTPLIVSIFAPKKVAQHGSDAPMKCVGKPAEVGPATYSWL